MPVGSTWTSQVRNSGSYGTQMTQSGGKIVQVSYKGAMHIGFEGPAGTTITAPTGDWITQVGPDGKPIVSWDPPIGFNWPLEVGKTWTRQLKMTMHATDQSMDITSNAMVEAYEDVTVPAGTFKAFRVRATNNVGSEDTFWFSPAHGVFVKQVLKRTDRAPQGAGVREVELTSISPAR